MKHFLLILIALFFNSLSIFASVNQDDIAYISISFGENLKEIIVPHNINEENFTWQIKNDITGLLISQGNGIALLDYVFSEPGNFVIEISHSHDHENLSACTHSSFPETINLSVSNHKITYLVEELTISDEIIGGIQIVDIIVSLPVIVESFDGNPVLINQKMTSSGIDCTIEGDLISSNTNLLPGRYNMKYSLSGKATSNSYITFNFSDNNGKISPYYHLNMIN